MKVYSGGTSALKEDSTGMSWQVAEWGTKEGLMVRENVGGGSNKGGIAGGGWDRLLWNGTKRGFLNETGVQKQTVSLSTTGWGSPVKAKKNCGVQ